MRQALARAAIVLVLAGLVTWGFLAFTDVGKRYQCPPGRAPLRTSYGAVVCVILAEPIE